MDNFLEIYSSSKLNQEIDHLNRSITRREIDSAIIIILTNLLHTEVQDQMASQANFTKHTKKNLYQFSNFQNIEEEGTVPKTFYEATITLKTDTPQKRKLQANIFDEHRCKNFQQNISKQNSTAHEKYHTPQPSGIHCMFTKMVQNMQINECNTEH